MKNKIKQQLAATGFLQTPGAFVLVDGQFGSTGKGLAASVLAELFHDRVSTVITNAGPNSGHTSYFKDEKIVLRQLPTFGVVAYKMGSKPTIFMDHGAILDTEILNEEIQRYAPNAFSVLVSPHAAVVSKGSKELEAHLVKDIGSTGKGTGGALAAKVLRNPEAVAAKNSDKINAVIANAHYTTDNTYFVEVSQGYSLGLNAGMYPYTTSRDCTVGAAMADAGLHPSLYRDSMMVVRTYPIRVAGNSGPAYRDQKELTWEELGQEPELTTVTQKVRRVFTWSAIQYQNALLANRPGYVFCNFVNYLKSNKEIDAFVRYNIVEDYERTLGRKPKGVLLGYGPRNEDVFMWEGM